MLFCARRAALVLFVLAPILVYASTSRVCPHRVTFRPAGHTSLVARRRKRGSRDPLQPGSASVEATLAAAIPPQTARLSRDESVSRAVTCRLWGADSRDITSPVTADEAKMARRMLVARNMRAIRESRGISQDRLAEMLGVSRRQILRWEGAYIEPREHLGGIAAALGCTVADLYADREPAQR